MTAADVRAADRDVDASGRGLPAGSGRASEGAVVFAARCAACHANGSGLHDIVQGWPYAPTLFDYIRRAMPPERERPLSAADVYALTAFILEAEHVIGGNAVLDRATLPNVRMPGKATYIRDDAGPLP